MNHNVTIVGIIKRENPLKMPRNIVRVQSPSFTRVKEGDLPLLRFSNLTCMHHVQNNGHISVFAAYRCVLIDFTHLYRALLFLRILSGSYDDELMSGMFT